MSRVQTLMANGTSGTVRSADGTIIAFQRVGQGPSLIMVDPAGAHRDFNPMTSLAQLLSPDFTTIMYDRRGRGESGDTLPYAVEREVEDPDALVAEHGGSAFLYGASSGALLALHAAEGGLAIPKMALFEPPISMETNADADRAFTSELAELVSAGHRREAVEFFYEGLGVPPALLAELEPANRAALESVAHTLVYDCLVSNATTAETLRSVAVPTLVIDSVDSSGDLTGWAAAVAEGLPDGAHRSLLGEWHSVADEDLAPVLVEFFRS